MKVIVVGAGIIGSLIAYRLVQAGAEVTLIDAGLPAHAASGASFGWINASFYADNDHFNLRAAGIEAHRRLAADLESDAVQWPGCLCWEHQGDALESQYKALKDLGYTVDIISEVTFARIEPFAVAPSRALYFPGEGCVDLAALTCEAIASAASGGLRLIMGHAVTGLSDAGGRISGVETVSGRIAADRVVVAAGVATEAILKGVGVALPMLKRPGLMVRSEPLKPLLRHILVSPVQELRQTPQGHLLAPAAASHQSDASESIDQTPDVLADRTMQRVSALIGRDVAWEQVTLAHRPVPHDGLPAVGACGPEGLYVTTMHSGATLAPLVAEMAASEIMQNALGNEQSALLAPYRPARFTD
ncbi:D-amino acid dehydrogenase [Roseobacter fucihabitans]|uniref:D-amino acid dehydrogenase n=1 Tax=Roseobacter fucihabitans TaxID=1537242 RepID=A0ABZ2BS60_9RHOB|nr:FAD-dependent oxidoreductase [Roseobacter litoralis]MBC6966138.1 D-amino acid dehydrogenase small subunit [Roseobacter litoralis]